MTTSKTFVLIHGAWHGAWCWQETAAILKAEGHSVFTPTLVGVGERSREMSIEIDLMSTIDDAIAQVQSTGLTNITLVGHSFAGPVITGMADRIPGLLTHLIYLDCGWLENGEALFDTLPDEIVAQRKKLALDFSDGLALPPPPPEVFGVTDADGAAKLREMLTPHPIATYTTPLELEHQPTNGLPTDYLVCTSPYYEPLEASRKRVLQFGIPIHPLAAPHDAMVTHPNETANKLLRL